MSRIEIEAGGRRITINHDGELAHLADTAHNLWQKTNGPEPSAGPAIGFVAEKAPQWDHDKRRPTRAEVP